jgi:hypothetical protein
VSGPPGLPPSSFCGRGKNWEFLSRCLFIGNGAENAALPTKRHDINKQTHYRASQQVSLLSF